ncbi:MAG: NAD(P)-dependent oxidoreductase [Myxococcota bacterium]
MKIVVFGPTGGTGKVLVSQALARGHHVNAFARTPSKVGMTHPNLTVTSGDVLDPLAVENALVGQDVVVVSLGSSGLLQKDQTCSIGTRHILAGMKKVGLRRLIVCSSMGVGDSRPHVPAFVRFMLQRPLADKEVQERDIQASGLDWVIVRPTGLVDEPARGELTVVEQGPVPISRISRADVASFMLDQLSSDQYLHRTPGISWKG